jgi:hypothetical protein
MPMAVNHDIASILIMAAMALVLIGVVTMAGSVKRRN